MESYPNSKLGSSQSKPSLPHTAGSTKSTGGSTKGTGGMLSSRRPNSQGSPPRVSKAHPKVRRRSGPPQPLPGHVAWLPVQTTPLGRDAANRLPRAARSAVLPSGPLVTAELLPARLPARPSARCSPGSSLVRPPGRGLSACPPLAA